MKIIKMIKQMKTTKLFCVLISVFFIIPANAKTNSFNTNDGTFLIKSCREAIEIFENKSEKRFLAAQMTSVSEAMRAGYCIGVLEQYNKENHYCSYGDIDVRNWYQMAKIIANEPYYKNGDTFNVSSSTVLKKAYCYE